MGHPGGRRCGGLRGRSSLAIPRPLRGPPVQGGDRSTLTTQGPNASRISPSGEFAFGFRPSDADASVYLFAVWFNKITSKTVVWYANTNTNTNTALPAGSQLQLTPGGVLSLQDPAGTEIWNPRVTNVDHAAMLDTGNFVLYAKDGSIKWQSFEHPTDTILPSQELPKGSVLQSRLMDNDYSAGRFQLSVEADGNLRFYTLAVPYTVVVPSLFRYDRSPNTVQLLALSLLDRLTNLFHLI